MDGTSSLTSSPFMAPFNGLAPPPPPPPMPTTSANNNNNSYELPPPFSFLSNVNSSNASQASTTQAALPTHFGIGSSSHNGGGGDGGLSSNNASSSIIITSGGGSNNTEKCIWVLDPMTRKLRVPLTYLVPTQATATHGTVPSLCIAFLEGRCRHPWCRQAHVMPSMISQLRHDALNAPTCCARHHDPHEITMLTSRFATITVSESSMQSAIPTDCIALTVGLQRYIAHSVPPDLPGPNLDIPSKLICRLHLSHRCRYLEDCNNIHVCREFDLRLHPPPFMMGPLQNLNVATRSIVLGDVVYSVTPLAVGELCDEDFHMICEQQQNRHQSSSTNNAAAPHHNGHSATNSNVQSPFLQSTSNSPLLCGIPYVDAALGGYGATSGGNQPLLHGTTHPSESPLHGAMHGSHTGGGMGTPNASFSTPPLAAMRQSTSAPSTGMLPPPAFSSPPSGLPTFCSQTPNGSTTAAAETTSHNVWTTPNNATSQAPRSTSPTRPAATTWSAHLAAANTLTLASTQQQQSQQQNSQGHHPSSEQQLGNSSISKQLLDAPGGGKQSPTSAGAGSATTTMLPPPPFGAASTSSPAPSGVSSPNAKRQPLRVYDIRTTVGGPTHHHQHHHVSPVLQGQQHYALPPPPSHHAHQHHQHPAHHHHRHSAPHYQQHAAPPYNGGSMTPEGAGRPQSHHHVQ